SSSFTTLGATGADEVLQRTGIGRELSDIALGLVRYPFEVLGNLLPWSIFLFAAWVPAVRATIARTWREESLFRFSVVACAWTVFLLWWMPGSLGRYVMPAYPFFALALATPLNTIALKAPARVFDALWLILGFGFVAYAVERANSKPNVELLISVPLAILLVALVGFAKSLAPFTVRLTLLLGLLYALAFNTIHAPSRVERFRERQRDLREWSLGLAEHAKTQGLDPKTVPIGCSHGVTQTACFEIIRTLGRSTTRPERNPRPSYAIGDVQSSPLPESRQTLRRGHGLELWFMPRSDGSPPSRDTQTNAAD
ncbi:MAG: hypothetical protein AAFQ82_02500, partial [Myxococcota bacterium]